MAQVCLTIDGRPADIHTYDRRVEWYKKFFLASEGIIDFEMILHKNKVRSWSKYLDTDLFDPFDTFAKCEFETKL